MFCNLDELMASLLCFLHYIMDQFRDTCVTVPSGRVTDSKMMVQVGSIIMQLSRTRTTRQNTHTTPSCILQAVEWCLYSGGRKIQQQQSAKTTGRGSLKDAGPIVMRVVGRKKDVQAGSRSATKAQLCKT